MALLSIVNDTNSIVAERALDRSATNLQSKLNELSTDVRLFNSWGISSLVDADQAQQSVLKLLQQISRSFAVAV